MAQAHRRQEAGGNKVAMIDQKPDRHLKKVVGKKKSGDLWDELYRLNTFAANLGLLRPANDGYSIRKVVGKPRAR
jgi:hypothetical protein